MKSVRLFFLWLFCAFCLWPQAGGDFPSVSAPMPGGYDHDRWGTGPRDIFFEFTAFVLSFDGPDDDNGDGLADLWGVPEWVSYEIRAQSGPKGSSSPRPGWTTDPELYAAGIAPGDGTYAVPGAGLLGEVKGDYRFVRGHMCPKDTAERISSQAARETHTLLNAVPQLQWQNNGIWKTLENLCAGWADKYGRVWVVCGPVFFGKNPALWLGQNGEKPAAVPDALFKIVIREGASGGPAAEALAFLIPNILPRDRQDPGEFLTAISRVEELTGLSFLAVLGPAAEELKAVPGDLGRW